MPVPTPYIPSLRFDLIWKGRKGRGGRDWIDADNDSSANGPEVNRFAGDWVTHHIFSSLRVLSSQQESAHAFLKNGGIAWASKVRNLKPEDLAESARAAGPGGDIKSIAQNSNTPQLVKDALNMMQMATAHVLGTDGHRRLCRHEGHAYTILFGTPLVFATPNLADGKQVLLLVAQNEEVYLDQSQDTERVLPKYREMLLRLAKDPVGQTLVFHLIMRLFSNMCSVCDLIALKVVVEQGKQTRASGALMVLRLLPARLEFSVPWRHSEEKSKRSAEARYTHIYLFGSCCCPSARSWQCYIETPSSFSKTFIRG